MSDNALGGSLTELASSITGSSYTVASVVKGKTYKFKIQARNLYGYSVLSSEVSILAAQLPQTPNTPTTTFSVDYVYISWVKPDNMGSTITAYSIVIQKSDGSYQELPTYCDGTSSAIISAL